MQEKQMTEAEIMKALEKALAMSDEPIGEHFYCGLTTKIVKEVQDFINRKNAEIERLEYTLAGVMHSVDKWLDGDELKQDEVNRAITMREKTLRIVETAKAEAIKEFWNNRPERLNDQCKGKEEFHKGWNACLDEFWDIRNHLLKEMGVKTDV